MQTLKKLLPVQYKKSVFASVGVFAVLPLRPCAADRTLLRLLAPKNGSVLLYAVSPFCRYPRARLTEPFYACSPQKTGACAHIRLARLPLHPCAADRTLLRLLAPKNGSVLLYAVSPSAVYARARLTVHFCARQKKTAVFTLRSVFYCVLMLLRVRASRKTTEDVISRPRSPPSCSPR